MFEQPNLTADVLGSELRTSRRNFGMSQAQLSSLLGLSQARISRWENGREEIPRKHRLAILDIFRNSRGQISPLIDDMLRNDSGLSVMDGKSEMILRESPQVLRAYRLERADVDGAEHARVFNAQWKNNTHIEYDFCSVEYFRDVELADVDDTTNGFRCHVKMVSVGLEGYDRIILRRTEFVGPSVGQTGLQATKWVLPSSFDSD